MNFPESIDQLWIYGSHARGDFDKYSDVDILMVSDSDQTDYVASYFSKKYSGKIEISHYNYDGLIPMIENGSLFAHHLKKEAKPLYQRTGKLERLLGEMPCYGNHVKDLRIIEALICDVSNSLHLKNKTEVFEAGVLGMAVRNTAIIMCNFLGADDYSPWAPLKLKALEKAIAMPLTEIEYRFLQECRRLGERGCEIKARVYSDKKLSSISSDIGIWRCACEDYICNKEAA